MAASLKLPDTISSPDQIMAFIEDLADYQAYIRKLNVAAKVKVDSPSGLESPSMPIELVEFLKSQFGNEEVAIARLEEIKTFFKEVKASCPSIHIMMAYLPTVSERAEIVHWFRNNIAENILINFTQNSDVIGGLLIRTRTKIFDMSFRTVLLANKARLAELIG